MTTAFSIVSWSCNNSCALEKEGSNISNITNKAVKYFAYFMLSFYYKYDDNILLYFRKRYSGQPHFIYRDFRSFFERRRFTQVYIYIHQHCGGRPVGRRFNPFDTRSIRGFLKPNLTKYFGYRRHTFLFYSG